MNSNTPMSDRSSKRSLTPKVRNAIPLPPIANGVEDQTEVMEVEEIEDVESIEELEFEDQYTANVDVQIANEKKNLKVVRDLMAALKDNEESIKATIQEYNNAKSAYKRAELRVRARNNGNA
jgi:hypothetical protein